MLSWTSSRAVCKKEFSPSHARTQKTTTHLYITTIFLVLVRDWQVTTRHRAQILRKAREAPLLCRLDRTAATLLRRTLGW